MSAPRGPGIGVIGLGFMGSTHLRAYADAAVAGHANHLVHVCDPDVVRLNGGGVAGGNIDTGEGPVFDPATTRTSTSPEPLLADPDVELVSIATPTDTHVDLAIAALEAGKHVLLEKPVALATADAERLATVARGRPELHAMPALCMRFWPGWSWLKDAVASGRHGRARSAVFRRLAARPAWSPRFYGDVRRTGGALFDLHVHDADVVRWLFGDPAAVHATGDRDHVTTSYRYADGPRHVVAEGGWDHAPGFAFRMEFTVVFETATAEFVFGREHPLVLVDADGARPVPLPDVSGYDGQVRHLLDVVAGRTAPLASTVDEAVGLTRLLEAEARSLDAGELVPLGVVR